jgi:phosphoribosylglycinamide formyltransferase-1
VSTLFNLIVELDTLSAPPEIGAAEIAPPQGADDRTLAWIDDAFGGAWSSEAAAGTTIVARIGGAPAGFASFGARGLKYRWLDGLARERDVGLFGPFGLAPQKRESGLGVRLLRLALEALRERGYRRALIPAVGTEALVRYYARAAGARVAERFDREMLLAPKPRTVVMASGNGSNFQAVADAARAGTLPIEIVALVCNNARAVVLERAQRSAVSSAVLEWNRAEETRAGYDARLLESVRREKPDLIVLLGWMHLLSEAFVGEFADLLNLHPAFLPLDPARDDVILPDGTQAPAFRGARAVRDALAAGSGWTGATVHRVTPQTDRGPVLARKPLHIEPGEEEPHLMARLHEVEHRLVGTAIRRWLFERPHVR